MKRAIVLITLMMLGAAERASAAGLAELNSWAPSAAASGVPEASPAEPVRPRAEPTVLDIPYFDLARREAAAQGVDLALVLAIIEKESSFRPGARSAKGARGLMQVLPATARQLGLRNAAKRLYEPAVNIRYGVKYLKTLLDAFYGGDASAIPPDSILDNGVQMAVAAYNAGPGHVGKYGGVPPFSETRDYVQKVTGNFRGYKRLLGGGERSLADARIY